MSEILVLTHPYDHFLELDEATGDPGSRYLLFRILMELMGRGHTFTVLSGIPDRAFEADAAILHVDASRVPADLLAYAATFPVCLNLGAADITKRAISGALLARGEAWPGPVISKSNLNCGGVPELVYNHEATLRGEPEPFPGLSAVQAYTVHGSPAEVPAAAWEDPDLVLERFIPEPDPDGYALRFWVFCGEREHCNRYVSPEPFVKGSNVIRREPVPVPEELRARRRELGFDFGKFDFVLHEGRAVLLDANKTPSQPPDLSGDARSRIANLADGFEALLTRR